MSPKFGLFQDELNKIIEVVGSYPEVELGVIFGSRALGNYKKGSDVDISLMGKNLEEAILDISVKLNEESLLPYFFDIVDYNSLATPELKDHINRVGVEFYRKF